MPLPPVIDKWPQFPDRSKNQIDPKKKAESFPHQHLDYLARFKEMLSSSSENCKTEDYYREPREAQALTQAGADHT